MRRETSIMSVVIVALFSIGFIFGVVEGQRDQSAASDDENCFRLPLKVKADNWMKAEKNITKSEYIGCGNCGRITTFKGNSTVTLGDLSLDPWLAIWYEDGQCVFHVCFTGK